MKSFKKAAISSFVLLLIAGSASAQCARELTASDGAALDRFGYCADITTGAAYIGAPSDDRGALTDAGAVYWFSRGGLEWTQSQKIIASDSQVGADFGTCVSIGSYLVIGAPRADTQAGAETGAVYVYGFNSATSLWEFQSKVGAPDGATGDKFGVSVCTWGSWMVVGAPEDDNARGNSAGAAYLYHRNSNGTWAMIHKIVNADGVDGDRNGWAVSISGNNVVTSAYFADTNGLSNNAAVYTYRYDYDSIAVLPTFEAKLTASDAYSTAGYGFRIASSYDTIVVGDPVATVNGMNFAGKFYSYTRNSNGTWTEQIGVPTPVVAGRNYGKSVSLNGHRVAVGGEGAAAVFNTATGTPTQEMVIVDPSDTPDDAFGSGIAVYGNELLASDMWQSPAAGSQIGNANIFYLNPVGADACSGAPIINVTDNIPIIGCTEMATASGVGPSCAATSSSNDVFFRFTPTCTGTYTVSTEGSDYDTVLSVHFGCPANSGTAIGCNDDVVVGNHDSRLTLGLTANQTYYIRVGGYQTDAGTFVLAVNPDAAPPTNDTCSGATMVGNGSYTVATCFATFDNSVESCHFGTTDVWYRYVPACSGIATIQICQHNFDPTLDVYGAVCASSTQSPIACNDDDCAGFGSRVEFFVTAGAHYLVRVGSWSGITGTGTMMISCNDCPCNWNHDAFVNSQDFFDFVTAFFQNNADYNLDGLTNSQDYFDFVTCFFSGC